MVVSILGIGNGSFMDLEKLKFSNFGYCMGRLILRMGPGHGKLELRQTEIYNFFYIQ